MAEGINIEIRVMPAGLPIRASTGSGSAILKP